MGNGDKEDDVATLSLDGAVNKTGNGRYNIGLTCVNGLILLGVGMDLFGFPLIIAAACDLDIDVNKKSILQSLPFIGIFISSFIWGYISDTKGRRFTLIIAVLLGSVFSTLCCLSRDWIALGALKFISICFTCAGNSATYTLVGESCPEHMRGKYLMLMTSLLLFSPAMAAILTYPIVKLDFAIPIPALGIIFSPWRLICIVLAIPGALGGLAMYFFFESPKYLAHIGKTNEALTVLSKMYAINHKCKKEDYKVNLSPIVLDQQEKSLYRKIVNQSAPIFRMPLLKTTLKLFYLTFVVFITNNSFLMWFPHVMHLLIVYLNSDSDHRSGTVCTMIANHASKTSENIKIIPHYDRFNKICQGEIDDVTILASIASQTSFAIFNFIISLFPKKRKWLMMLVICFSSASGLMVNLMPEPISSTFFFVCFPCTCLCMGILASYFVDFYPTSYRGMAQCLSVMVGRTSAFFGINILKVTLFDYCKATLYCWSILLLCSAIVVYLLPHNRDED